jgi:isoleucyl-tRNA synthetase
VVDNSTGEKISKSGEKPINAEYYYNKYGADIVRLWVASVDYRNEVPFSDELFAQVVESYRRLRNTLRILLANLHGFDAEKHSTEPTCLADRWILERLHALVAECREAYDVFEFRRVFNAINQFCTNELSALYVDMTKDRLYCDAADSPRRRSAQTAMHRISDALCRLLAPVLAFTADEAWEHAGMKESVHLQDFPTADPAHAQPVATPIMDRLLAHREELAKELEKARAAKTIGKSLEAEVTAALPADLTDGSLVGIEELAEIFMLSRIEAKPVAAGEAPAFQVARSTAPRCGRCWRHLPEVGSIPTHPDLCPRCASAL